MSEYSIGLIDDYLSQPCDATVEPDSWTFNELFAQQTEYKQGVESKKAAKNSAGDAGKPEAPQNAQTDKHNGAARKSQEASAAKGAAYEYIYPAGDDYEGYIIRIGCRPREFTTDGNKTAIELAAEQLGLDKKLDMTEEEKRNIRALAQEICAINVIDSPAQKILAGRLIEIPGHDARTGTIIRVSQAGAGEAVIGAAESSASERHVGKTRRGGEPAFSVLSSKEKILEPEDFFRSGQSARLAMAMWQAYALSRGMRVNVDVSDLPANADVSKELASRALKKLGFSDEVLKHYPIDLFWHNNSSDVRISQYKDKGLIKDQTSAKEVPVILRLFDLHNLQRIKENLQNGYPPDFNPYMSQAGMAADEVRESGVGTKKDGRNEADAAAAGLVEGYLGVEQFLGNFANIAAIAAKKLTGNWDEEANRASVRQEFYDQLAMESALSQLPETENVWWSRLIRGGVSGAVQLPVYAAAGLAGPAGPIYATAIQNAHLPIEQCLAQSLATAVAMPLSVATRGYVGNLKIAGVQRLIAEQALPRLAGGAGNAAGQLINGEADAKKLTEAFVLGMVMEGKQKSGQGVATKSSGAIHERAGTELRSVIMKVEGQERYMAVVRNGSETKLVELPRDHQFVRNWKNMRLALQTVSQHQFDAALHETRGTLEKSGFAHLEQAGLSSAKLDVFDKYMAASHRGELIAGDRTVASRLGKVLAGEPAAMLVKDVNQRMAQFDQDYSARVKELNELKGLAETSGTTADSARFEEAADEIKAKLGSRVKSIQESLDQFSALAGLPNVKVELAVTERGTAGAYMHGDGKIVIPFKSLAAAAPQDVGSIAFHELVHFKQDVDAVRLAVSECMKEKGLKEAKSVARDDIKAKYQKLVGSQLSDELLSKVIERPEQLRVLSPKETLELKRIADSMRHGAARIEFQRWATDIYQNFSQNHKRLAKLQPEEAVKTFFKISDNLTDEEFKALFGREALPPKLAENLKDWQTKQSKAGFMVKDLSQTHDELMKWLTRRQAQVDRTLAKTDLRYGKAQHEAEAYAAENLAGARASGHENVGEAFTNQLLQAKVESIEFHKASPFEDAAALNNADSYTRLINCVPCVAALFRTLQTGILVRATDIKKTVSNGEFPKGKAVGFLEQQLGIKFSHFKPDAGNPQNLMQQLPEGHYALVLNSLPGRPDDGHVVYARKKGDTLSVYDPQGNFFYGSRQLLTLLTMKPDFFKAEAQEGSLRNIDSLIPREAKHSMAVLSEAQVPFDLDAQKQAPPLDAQAMHAERKAAIDEAVKTGRLIEMPDDERAFLASLWLASRQESIDQFVAFMKRKPNLAHFLKDKEDPESAAEKQRMSRSDKELNSKLSAKLDSPNDSFPGARDLVSDQIAEEVVAKSCSDMERSWHPYKVFHAEERALLSTALSAELKHLIRGSKVDRPRLDQITHGIINNRGIAEQLSNHIEQNMNAGLANYRRRYNMKGGFEEAKGKREHEPAFDFSSPANFDRAVKFGKDAVNAALSEMLKAAPGSVSEYQARRVASMLTHNLITARGRLRSDQILSTVRSEIADARAANAFARAIEIEIPRQMERLRAEQAAAHRPPLRSRAVPEGASLDGAEHRDYEKVVLSLPEMSVRLEYHRGFYYPLRSDAYRADCSSPIKVHVDITDGYDLRRVQEALIPLLMRDPELKSLVGEWKTLNPRYFERPDPSIGKGQLAKGFTIYTDRPEKSMRIAQRLDDVLRRAGLGLDEQCDSGNVGWPLAGSNRVTLIRDVFHRSAESKRNQPLALLGSTLQAKIESHFGNRRLNDNELRAVEHYAGIESGTLRYDSDGCLALRCSRESDDGYHGGVYVTEGGAETTFGHMTDRPAMYSLFATFGLDPATKRPIRKK